MACAGADSIEATLVRVSPPSPRQAPFADLYHHVHQEMSNLQTLSLSDGEKSGVRRTLSCILSASQ